MQFQVFVMLEQRITLKKLSEKLNISISTVSRALKDHPDISQKTKLEVKRLANQLNYVPNFVAQSLRNRSTKTIGVIIPRLTLDHSSKILNGMIIKSREMGYRLIISESGHNYELEKDILSNMISSGLDGILLSLSNSTSNVDHILAAQKRCPLVLYDKVSDKVPCTKIIVDDEVGAYNAVTHLIEQGCQNILHFKGAENSLSAKKRFEGYLRALKTHNIEINNSFIKRCNKITIEEGKRIAQEFIDQKISFDGIFGVTDNIAIGAIKCLKENKIRIPEDVAVIGFSNDGNTIIVEPNLSSVNQPGNNLGTQAIKYLIEQIETPDTDYDLMLHHKTVELKTSLIIRESSFRKA